MTVTSDGDADADGIEAKPLIRICSEGGGQCVQGSKKRCKPRDMGKVGWRLLT